MTLVCIEEYLTTRPVRRTLLFGFPVEDTGKSSSSTRRTGFVVVESVSIGPSQSVTVHVVEPLGLQETCQ